MWKHDLMWPVASVPSNIWKTNPWEFDSTLNFEHWAPEPMAAPRVRIQEHPGWRNKQLTTTTAGLSAEAQTECHWRLWQQRRGRQRVHTAARRLHAPETTCGPYTGREWQKITWTENCYFDREKHLHWLSLTARQIAGNLEVEAMTSDSRPSV